MNQNTNNAFQNIVCIVFRIHCVKEALVSQMWNIRDKNIAGSYCLFSCNRAIVGCIIARAPSNTNLINLEGNMVPINWAKNHILCDVLPLTSPEYHIYALLIWIIIGSDDGVLPVRHQAIDWTSDDFSSIRFRETLSIKMWSRLNNFHWQNYTQNYHL